MFPSLSYCSTPQGKHAHELMNGLLITPTIHRPSAQFPKTCPLILCCIPHDLTRYTYTQPATQSTDLHGNQPLITSKMCPSLLCCIICILTRYTWCTALNTVHWLATIYFSSLEYQTQSLTLHLWVIGSDRNTWWTIKWCRALLLSPGHSNLTLSWGKPALPCSSLELIQPLLGPLSLSKSNFAIPVPPSPSFLCSPVAASFFWLIIASSHAQQHLFPTGF